MSPASPLLAIALIGPFTKYPCVLTVISGSPKIENIAAPAGSRRKPGLPPGWMLHRPLACTLSNRNNRFTATHGRCTLRSSSLWKKSRPFFSGRRAHNVEFLQPRQTYPPKSFRVNNTPLPTSSRLSIPTSCCWLPEGFFALSSLPWANQPVDARRANYSGSSFRLRKVGIPARSPMISIMAHQRSFHQGDVRVR
jgi:hypothetical protein